MAKIKIIILEDNKEVAMTLRDLINQTDDMFCCAVYHSAEESFAFVQKHKADIMIVDLGLPGIDGIEAIKKLSVTCPKMQFCVFTVYGDDDKIFPALEIGAKGYILKTTDKTRLIDSLRELHFGGSPMSPYIARKVIEKLTAKSEDGHADPLPITERENKLLGLLAQGYSYKEISDKLFITEGTVKQHLHNIYFKLQVSNKTQAINLYNSKNKT